MSHLQFVQDDPARRYAVILLAHGTPDELSDIPKYLSNVVSGRPMPQHVIDEITHRYGLIGKSPLTALTMEQGRLLSHALRLPVYVGMRNWRPYIVDTVKQMKADGITDAVAICLAPQNSRTSTGLYRRAVFAEAGEAMRIDFIEGWADHPELVEAFAARLGPVLKSLGTEYGVPVPVLFTAHSVPCRTIQAPAAGARPLAIGAEASTNNRPVLSSGLSSVHTRPSPGNTLSLEEDVAKKGVIPSGAKDLRVSSSSPGTAAIPGEGSSLDGGHAALSAPPAPAEDATQWVRSSAEVPAADGRPTPPPDPYPVDAKRTASLIAARLGLPADRWYFAFQSQGMAGGPWIGPTVEDTLTALHRQGARAVVLHTIGFLCDHVEILYDIDIAFKQFAAELSMRLERPASLNESPLLTEALADLAGKGLARLAAATKATPALMEAR